jgi:hypothetical protein
MWGEREMNQVVGYVKDLMVMEVVVVFPSLLVGS